MKYEMQICWVSNLQTFTAKIFITFLFLLVTQLALAQFHDPFSDGDFVLSPEWTGDTPSFTVINGQLKLNALQEDGIAFLSTPSALGKNGQWEWSISMEFNPSAGNYARIYVTADQANLTGPLNGYFVMVGNSDDEVSLYKQEGSTFSKIIDGRNDILDLSAVGIKIKVTHNENEGWKLFTSLKTTDEYVLEGSTEDQALSVSKNFGILCKYTSTRSDKFLFDDFKVDETAVKDEISPLLMDIQVVSRRELKLAFSEPMDKTIASNVERYVVDHLVGQPSKATPETDASRILLTFDKDLPENIYLQLNISGLADLAGNKIDAATKDFIVIAAITASIKDVIITEIFADPSPPVSLPETEYLEIYNRSESAINLAGWKLTDQSSVAVFPETFILPKEYLILIHENVDFSGFEKALALAGFPTLNNANDILILKDNEGLTIDSINYADTWYKHDDKSQGGWSLEIIDPNNICSEHENWIASDDAAGGTPGKQNAVFANKPDLTGPRLLSAIPLDPTTVQLQFDEKLEKQLPSSTAFEFTPPADIDRLWFANGSLTGLQLSLKEPIQPHIGYSIKAKEVYDCAGNVINESYALAVFGLPEEADSLDVLINEVLFNPRPTGVDFVELANNAAKFINLKDWSIANLEDGVVHNETKLTSNDFLLKPGDFLAITTDPAILKGEYLLSHEEDFLAVANLPSLNDDDGSVVLLDPNGRVINYFKYTKEMHSIFVKEDEGISLERISNQQSPDDQNWKSASSAVGFATPGYLNSNAMPDQNMFLETIKVQPEIFNPLGDKQNFVLINYNLEQGGYIANLKIFDSQGHLIKDIANNDILGTTGFYRWDGDRYDGIKARVGYYMIWFEIFDEQGVVKSFKKRVAIATAF